jgi:hypothetical protein
MRRYVASHLVKLWFRLTFLLASLTGMATTIVAEEGARCGVVGMIELGAGPGSSTTCCRISVICPNDRRARTAMQFQAHSACRCQRASIQDIPVRVLRLKRTRVRGHPQFGDCALAEATVVIDTSGAGRARCPLFRRRCYLMRYASLPLSIGRDRRRAGGANAYWGLIPQ